MSQEHHSLSTRQESQDEAARLEGRRWVHLFISISMFMKNIHKEVSSRRVPADKLDI